MNNLCLAILIVTIFFLIYLTNQDLILAALVSMLTNNPAWKGVVGTVPDLLASPFFQMVGDPSALVPLDATDDKDIMAASPQLLCECDSLKVFTVLE